jgi:hypothetical protein
MLSELFGGAVALVVDRNPKRLPIFRDYYLFLAIYRLTCIGVAKLAIST